MMNMKSTIGELVAKILNEQLVDDFEAKPFLSVLIACGCDYFELMETVIKINPTLEDIEFFIGLAPCASKLPNLELLTIHGMIPRWTSTKYHTAPIDDVLKEIRCKIRNRELGMYIYNSNLNIRNSKSPNDPYVLLIGETACLFLDLNRKRAFCYR